MSEFWNYFEIGVRHVLNRSAYEPILFLVALSVPFAFKDWKKTAILTSVFTVSFALALLLSMYGMMVIKSELIEIFIPFSIVIMAVYQLFTVGKPTKNSSISVSVFLTLLFGLVDGLKFANAFKAILDASKTGKVLPFLELSVGIEAVLIGVIASVLIGSYVAQSGFKFSKRDWTLVITSFVIGVVLPKIIENEIWFRK